MRILFVIGVGEHRNQGLGQRPMPFGWVSIGTRVNDKSRCLFLLGLEVGGIGIRLGNNFSMPYKLVGIDDLHREPTKSQASDGRLGQGFGPDGRPIRLAVHGELSDSGRPRRGAASDKTCWFEDFIGVWETWTGIWAGWASDKRLENKTSPRDIPEG